MGGVALIDQENLEKNQFAVQLTEETNGAYVDLSNYQPDIDKHRYISMSDASEDHSNLGEVIQYIGSTSADYIHGYFYMRVKEIVAGDLRRPTKWTDINPQTTAETLQSALTAYNRENDHCLVVDTPLYITPVLDEPGTIDVSTECVISNRYHSNTVTYADILQWGIQISSQYLNVLDITDLPIAIIDLNYPEQDTVWV
jgi:hypothetical protein